MMSDVPPMGPPMHGGFEGMPPIDQGGHPPGPPPPGNFDDMFDDPSFGGNPPGGYFGGPGQHIQ